MANQQVNILLQVSDNEMKFVVEQPLSPEVTAKMVHKFLTCSGVEIVQTFCGKSSQEYIDRFDKKLLELMTSKGFNEHRTRAPTWVD